MSKNTIIAGVGGILIGVLLMAVITSISNNSKTTVATTHSSMSMDDMTGQLGGKTGDEFDKAFISMMIVHHEGAVDMAELAKDNAKHQEVKDLAENIITAQNKEIAEMKTWQQAWGYTESSSHMGH